MCALAVILSLQFYILEIRAACPIWFSSQVWLPHFCSQHIERQTGRLETDLFIPGTSALMCTAQAWSAVHIKCMGKVSSRTRSERTFDCAILRALLGSQLPNHYWLVEVWSLRGENVAKLLISTTGWYLRPCPPKHTYSLPIPCPSLLEIPQTWEKHDQSAWS